MWLWAARLALLAAAITAAWLAVRRREHRPFAALLMLVAVGNTFRGWLGPRFGLIRPPGLPPFEGVQRIAFHVDQAIELSGSAAMIAVAVLLFARRRWLAALPGLAWLVLCAVCVSSYPELRGDALRKLYLGVELAALACSAAAIVVWGWHRERPTLARVCFTAVCLANLVMLLAGAQKHGFWTEWGQRLNQAALLTLYLITAATQVYFIWRTRRSSSSSP